MVASTAQPQPRSTLPRCPCPAEGPHRPRGVQLHRPAAEPRHSGPSPAPRFAGSGSALATPCSKGQWDCVPRLQHGSGAQGLRSPCPGAPRLQPGSVRLFPAPSSFLPPDLCTSRFVVGAWTEFHLQPGVSLHVCQSRSQYRKEPDPRVPACSGPCQREGQACLRAGFVSSAFIHVCG